MSHFIVVVSLVFLLLPKGVAQPLKQTWDGSYGSWNNTNSWSPDNEVPNEIGSGGEQHVAIVEGGGPTLANDVSLTGLTYSGGDITGDHSLTISDSFTLNGFTHRSLGVNSLILAASSQSAWINGDFDIWGSTEIHNYGVFNVMDALGTDLAQGIDAAHGTHSTFGGVFYNEAGGVLNQTGDGSVTFAIFNNAGIFSQNGGSVTFNGPVNNTGTFKQNSGTTSFNGQFVQTAGSYCVVSNATASGNLTFQGGRLTGTGVFAAYSLAVSHGTIIDPGNDLGQTGVLTIKNSISLAGGGIVHADIGGALPGVSCDQTILQNYPQLGGGMLEIALINGYLPNTNEVFVLVTTSDSSFLSGSFANVLDGGRLSTTNGSGSFLISYGTGTNSSSVVASDFIPTVPTLPPTLSHSVSGNTLTLNWPAENTGWILQVQTNSLATGLGNNWVNVPGSETTNSAATTINPTTDSVFYRLVAR